MNIIKFMKMCCTNIFGKRITCTCKQKITLCFNVKKNILFYCKKNKHQKSKDNLIKNSYSQPPKNNVKKKAAIK